MFRCSATVAYLTQGAPRLHCSAKRRSHNINLEVLQTRQLGARATAAAMRTNDMRCGELANLPSQIRSEHARAY